MLSLEGWCAPGNWLVVSGFEKILKMPTFPHVFYLCLFVHLSVASSIIWDLFAFLPSLIVFSLSLQDADVSVGVGLSFH